MQIYIRRKNERFGPYSREAVLEYVKQGIFNASDPACYAGMLEWKTVGEVVGIPDPAQPARAANPANPAGAAPAAAQARRRSAPATGEKKTAMIALNLALILIVIAAAYIRWGSGAQSVRRHIAEIIAGLGPAPANPDAKAAAEPNPLTPVIEKAPAATDAPTPAAATPAPAKPFDPADLARNPGAWPKTIRLKQEAVFPAMFNGQVVGSVKVPAGSAVKLLNVQGDQLVVDYQGGTQRLSWKLTDLEEAAKSVSATPGVQPVTEAAAGAYERPAWK